MLKVILLNFLSDAKTVKVTNMKGLEISREYFNTVAKPRLIEDFPELFPRLAAGLAGNGSECFGYDDEISRDHDWGTDFFIWVSDSDADYIPELTKWKENLFTFSPPKFARTKSEYGASINVMTCSNFFKQLIGIEDYSEDPIQWFRIPENNLAMCVNGEVFMDNLGEFTSKRNRFLSYFPEDFRLKKIAAKCMAIAQTGQYNHMRMAKRDEFVTVYTVISKFIDNVTGLVFLLNKVYRPYYKWENRMMRSLPVLGKEINVLINTLINIPGYNSAVLVKQQEVINEICTLLHQELIKQNLTSSDDWFFSTHGEAVMRKINHQVIRTLPATYE